jgi:hypothetical protein
LPLSYRNGAARRERAVTTMFGKLRIWDTEHNNGVLIYLLLADAAIEIVADRGLARHVDARSGEYGRAHGQKPSGAKSAEDRLKRGRLKKTSAADGAFAVAEFIGPTNELPDSPVLLITASGDAS